MEPDVKLSKTRELFNAGVSASAQIGKSADPTCYNAATVELRTGLFENVEREMTDYPVGGPRQPVYDLMRGLGFSMAKFGDKTWTSDDKITVHIYGAGSMARITDDAHIGAIECKLDNLAERIDSLRRG